MYKKARFVFPFISVILALSLSGCNSGGGGNRTTSPTTQFPLAAAANSYAQASSHFTLKTTHGSDTYTLQFGSTPGTPTTFLGLAASTAAETITITKNGAVIDTEAQNVYFQLNPYKPLGGISVGNGQYTVAANQVLLPTNATIGQTGQGDTETTYTDKSLSTIYSTATQTWSLLADTPTTAWFCVNTVMKIISPATTIPGDVCYQIDTSGSTLGLKLDITISGTTLNFR